MPIFLNRKAYFYFLKFVISALITIIIVGSNTWDLADFWTACDYKTLFRKFHTPEL